MNYQLRISIHGLDSTASYHRSRMQAPLTPGPGDEPNKIGITMESSIRTFAQFSVFYEFDNVLHLKLLSIKNL